MARVYNKKIVFSGNVIEIYDYSEKILSGYENKIEKQEREQTEEVKKENYHRSIKRTKNTVRNLINANFDNNKSSFLTLTFKENLTDYDVAFKYWDLFKKKVEYKYKLKLKYVGVVEFQERGAIHFHICLFNIRYINQKELYEMWLSVTTGGGVFIEHIDTESCDNVGAYVTKYMTKATDDFFDNEYKGRKRYFASRNLDKPIIEYYDTIACKEDKEELDKFLNTFKDNVVYQAISNPFVLEKKEEVIKEYDQLIEVYQDNLIDDKKILLDYEENIIQKKELVASVQKIQQVTYTQILVKLNKEKRDKFNKYINNYTVNENKNKEKI